MTETENKIVNLLAELYGWPDAAYWLMSPHDGLGGKRGDEMILAGKSDEVLALLERLRDGLYN